MNNLQHHTVIWNRTRYLLVDLDAEDSCIYHPSFHGFTPSPLCHDCKDGFYCTFHLAGDRLLMTQLNLMTAERIYSPIEGVVPLFCQEDHTMMYQRLKLQSGFTGTMRIGRGKVSNVFLPRCTLKSDSITELWDIECANGMVTHIHNRMIDVRQQIEMQNQVHAFIEAYGPDHARQEELRALCTYTEDEKSIPGFDVIHPDRVENMLAHIRATLNTPYWFIRKYADSGLSRGLTFDYLRELGMQRELLAFLEQFVGGAVTEKMVVLELLETMYRGIAAPYWEERVAPDYLYTNAKIPAEVTSSLRKRLSQVSLESWNVQESDARTGASRDHL